MALPPCHNGYCYYSMLFALTLLRSWVRSYTNNMKPIFFFWGVFFAYKLYLGNSAFSPSSSPSSSSPKFNFWNNFLAKYISRKQSLLLLRTYSGLHCCILSNKQKNTNISRIKIKIQGDRLVHFYDFNHLKMMST